MSLAVVVSAALRAQRCGTVAPTSISPWRPTPSCEWAYSLTQAARPARFRSQGVFCLRSSKYHFSCSAYAYLSILADA